jgi:hypothetical protein
MNSRRYHLFSLLILVTEFVAGCVKIPNQQDIVTEFKTKTGLAPLADGAYPNMLEKVHRGYPVLFRAEMGDVWGRYAARVAIGEAGDELGRIGAFLRGSYSHMHKKVVGSPLDRLLSRVIGQPLTIVVVLKHGKSNASRLDILSDHSTVKPDDPQPKAGSLGFLKEGVYSFDRNFAARIMSAQILTGRIEKFRAEYIRVDSDAVTFIFSGTETDYSGMINEHTSYYELINEVMNTIADIADLI